ncbi:MAG: sugar phosphate isomerase/epimerase [Luteolibacter sp.]
MKLESLLTLIPAASALLAMRSKGAPIAQATFTEAGFVIALQCWSLKEFTLFESIEMAAAAGMGGVEFYKGQKLGGDHGDLVFSENLPDEKVLAILEHLEKNHVSAVNFGVVEVPKDEREARKIFELANKLQLYGITTESLGSLDVLENLASEYDIKVCFHNHPKPTALWHPDTVRKAIEGRHENLGFCADVGHWASSGLDPLEVMRKIAPRVRSFHLKDRASITGWTHDQPFGTGIIDLPAILDEARKHGFAGNVTIEYEHNWKTNLAEIAQCVGYLRAYSKLRA